MDVLDELRVGEKVSEGRFRIDQKRALEKLKKNRLASPEGWIREVLRAAQASDAKHVDVRCDADDVEVSFDGRPFPAGVMKDLLAQALGADEGKSDPRHRLLALGVAGAMGLGLKRLLVESGKVRLEVDARGEVHSSDLDEAVPRTLLKARKAKRLGMLVDWAIGSKESALVAGTTRGYPPKLKLNGRIIEQQDLPEVHHDDDGLRLHVVPRSDGADFSEVQLYVWGVLAGTRQWALPGIQLHAYVFSDTMRFNASGSDIVDTDRHLTKAHGLCRKASLTMLSDALKEPTPGRREQIAKRLMTDGKLDEDARGAMETMPLFPGPSGERWSIAQIRAHTKNGRSLYIATRAHPKGSYPEPTVLINDESLRWAKLLPGNRREDVEPIVRKNQRAAENRLAWESQPPEEPVLPQRDWLATVDITSSKMRGQVGIDATGQGAWVRVLARGRFLQEGEVPMLAPYRLRAIVDLSNFVSDKEWAEIPNPKVYSRIVDEVAHAVEEAIAQAVNVREPSAAALAHARDVLARRAAIGAGSLPRAIKRLPLFRTLGGENASLEDLEPEPTWRFVPSERPHPPLDGSRVLVLNALEHQLLVPFSKHRLTDVSEQLADELSIRRRLDGPKERPVLERSTVAMTFNRNGVRGELGISTNAADRLEVTLLRDGFRLETTTLTARFGPAVAVVDSPALKPTSDWRKAVRDAAFTTVEKSLQELEAELLSPLLEKFPTFEAMPLAAREWLLRYAKREPGSQELLAARIFDGPKGPVSLGELKALGQKTGRVWFLPAWKSAESLEGQAAVRGDGDVEKLVKLATGLAVEDGNAELERLAAREALLSQPPWPSRVSKNDPLHVASERGRLACEAVLDGGASRVAECFLLIEGRLWRTDALPTALPMRVAVRVAGADPAEHVDAELRRELGDRVSMLQRKMLERALDESGPDARRAMFWALKARVEDVLSDGDQRRLLDRALFPCTDGAARSAAQLAAKLPVCFVTKPLEGTPRSERPVVIATDPDVLAGLQRFDCEDITEALEQELEVRAQRSRLQPVQRIELDAALVKLKVHGRIEGEVGISPAAQGRLELLFERRPLCTLPGALPLPLTAKVNCDALHPLPAHDGVAQDARYKKLLDELDDKAGHLGELLAERWPQLHEQPTAREAALRLCALLVTQTGRKKKVHPLLQLRLLKTTSGEALSVQQLLDEVKARDSVWVSERPGSLLEPEERIVWRTDREQRAWLEPLKLKTHDVTEELERADRVRARPRVKELTAKLESRWRQRIEATGMEGEVALPEAPTTSLVVELFQDRALLERYETEHRFGGAAAVNCDALLPNKTWSKAARNAQFKAVMVEVERALERAVARRLEKRDARWRAWADNAVRWGSREAGPVADVLPQLELFAGLDGKPVTVGAVLEEYARARRVAVADAGLDAADSLVLAATPETVEALNALGVTVKDVSPELKRQRELEAERRPRRLEQLSWPGDALVRVKVKAPGMNGELALPASDSNVEVVLAKAGVRVQALPYAVAPGVAGVVDIDDLLVDETWTQARLAPPEREVIEQAAVELLEAMARAVPKLSKEKKAFARSHVLKWMQHAGVKAAVQVDRMTGARASLASAPVFETTGGEWVGLTVLASEVRRRGRLAVFAKGLFRPDTGGVLGVLVRSVDEAWLDELERVLGPRSLERVKDVSLWRETQREEDPPEGSPELWGLERLRRDVKLLRAGALGQLSPEELEDVRLKALGGSQPVHYDTKRKIIFLDSQHAQVMRALSEAKVRRERLYVLLAAMYGAINRALHRVTDEHEEQLMAALASHLAANPQLLEAS